MLDSAGPNSDPNKLPLTLATCVKGEGEYGNSGYGDLILVRVLGTSYHSTIKYKSLQYFMKKCED